MLLRAPLLIEEDSTDALKAPTNPDVDAPALDSVSRVFSSPLTVFRLSGPQEALAASVTITGQCAHRRLRGPVCGRVRSRDDPHAAQDSRLVSYNDGSWLCWSRAVVEVRLRPRGDDQGSIRSDRVESIDLGNRSIDSVRRCEPGHGCECRCE